MTWDDGTAVRTLYGEVRGEPAEGQRAVAHVLLNRQKDGRWGKTLAQVCLAKYQFSCWLQSDENRQNFKSMLTVSDFDPVMIALSYALSAARQGPDPTNGATHYYAASMKKAPAWTLGAKFECQIGNHRFFSGVK